MTSAIAYQIGATKRRGDANGNWRGGKTRHPLYDIYNDMVGRCTRPTHLRFDSYGGRGISVCQRWLDDFWNFVEDMAPRPKGKSAVGRALWSLDRIDNNGNYEPSNCHWATNSEQASNKRGFGDGESRRNPVTGRYDPVERIAA